ncbi:hypothetical protein V7S43_013725 [Phytophthora oleae]|uniref:RxLR effector protein n=1 Tax=Phytophthora oleae TaxID=2107226 RepID=A0ABD3F3N1_9STRA
MRFSHFLLVATAALLSSCNAIATVSGEDQAITSADAAVPVRTLENNNSKRSLRYYEDEDEDEDKYDKKNGKYDEEEEERGVMTPAQVAKWTAKAKEWVHQKKTPAYIKDKLTSMDGVLSDKNREKYDLFTAIWGRANMHAFDRR